MVGVLHHRQLAPLTAPITCHFTTRHVILNFHISLAPNMKTHYICTLLLRYHSCSCPIDFTFACHAELCDTKQRQRDSTS